MIRILPLILLLTACGGGGGGTPPPAAGTLLSSSCDDYTLSETIADGNGGSTVRVTERSPKCGWNPPEKGTVIASECDGYTLVEDIADGEYGVLEVRRTERSPECGWDPPEAGTESGEWYCSAEGYDKLQDYHDGEYGTYTEVIEENSYDCGYEDPVAVFDLVHPQGDRFDPVVIEVSYEQFGEPYTGDMIIEWRWQETDSSIGYFDLVDHDTLHIYGDGRLGDGVILLNDGEFTYTMVEEPKCDVVDSIDCMGYQAASSIGNYPYYGEDDTRMVTWEYTVFRYAKWEDWPDYENGDIIKEYDRDDTNFEFFQRRVDDMNEMFRMSGVYVEIFLKHVYLAKYAGLNALDSMGRIHASDSDVILGWGSSYENTCGVAYANTKFIEGRPIGGLSRCDVKTDIHEIGHAIGLAHGPENQAYQANGYSFPEFAHGWNDYCGTYDDLMSYGYEEYYFMNSLLTCGDQFPDSTSVDKVAPAGDRSYRDTAYAINRVRYGVALIHHENKYRTELDKVLKEVVGPTTGPIIID